MENSKFKISANISYPSQLDSFEKKSSPETGKAIGDIIYSEWFYRSGNGGRCRFYNNRYEFQQRSLYANGMVDMRKYYDKLGTNGDVSLLNLSTKPLSTVPKIVDIVVNGMCNRTSSIKARATDPVSQESKLKYRQRIEEDQNALPIIQKAKEDFGFNVANVPMDQIPETKEELDIHLQMEWKPSNCLSNELAIYTVMRENEYEEVIKEQVVRDLVVYGMGATRTRLNPAKGIVEKRIDAIDTVYSQTKDPYFKDCFYKGHIEQVLLSDIFSEYPDLLLPENKEVAEEIKNSSNYWCAYQDLSRDYNLRGTAYVLYYTYKTFRERASKIKKKSNGEIIISDAKEFFDNSREQNEKDKYTRSSFVEEVLFEGAMILGTNILLKWELAKSMSRPQSNNQKVCDQYNFVAPNFRDGYISSLVARMMPIEDNRNVTELKAEQIIQGITPDGIAIDLDAMAEVEIADGKSQTAQDALNMYLQKGSYLYRSSTINGEYNNGNKPFQEIRTGDSINKLSALRNENAIYLEQLLDVVGLNKASDASNPDKDSLVGVYKMAAYNSNLATRHILKAANYLKLKDAETISYAISDILKYYPSLKEDLIRQIGTTAVEDLDYVKNLHLSDFAIYLEVEMDDEERAELNNDLSVAVEKGYIGLDDKYKIRNIKVLDLAIQYLSILIKKRKKIIQQEEAEKFRVQADENIRASQESEKAKQETLYIGAELDAKKQEAVTAGEIDKEKERGNQDRKTEEVKGKNKMEWQGLVNDGMIAKNNMIESEKKDRLAEQATQTSQIANQKANNKEPIDFVAKRQETEIFDGV